MSKQIYHNMGKLSRFLMRKDRIKISIWILSIALITVIVAPAFTQLYPSQAERQVMAETLLNPAMISMIGPGYGLDNYTLGAMLAHQMLLFTAVTVAIMSIFLVTSHTRGDEEGGRVEMIRSLPVGRLSSLSSSMIVVSGANVLLALLVGFGLYALNIESMGLKGSLVYGAALGATGIFFAAITALFAQLSENTRGTMGYSLTFLGLAYLLRAIGDVSSEALSWTSPLHWVMRSEAYVNNYLWPIMLTLIVAIAITALALYLNSIRDLEAGFIPAKPGRKNASRFLRSPVGLFLKLQKTMLISWGVGVLILGASYGSVLGDIDEYFKANEMIVELLQPIEGVSLTEQFIIMIIAVISMACAIPAVAMILKLNSEEKKNRTEHLLARAVSRFKVLGSYLLISVVTGFLMLLLSAFGLWSAGAAVMGDAISFGLILKATMVYLPAIWIMMGVAVLLIGFIPRAANLIWLYLGYSFFVVYFGGLLQFPEWMVKASPFGNIPKIPIEDMNVIKISIITIIAVAMMGVGYLGYSKRDIQGQG